MAFQQGLSGLNSSSQALDVIGNNISNSSTVGFKQSDAHFSDLYANALSGGGSNQVGIGSTVSNVAQQFTQGNITSTNNPLDVAVNGSGFFRLSNNGTYSYTRNGQFHLDKSNYLVNDQGYTVQGWLADANGTVVPGTPGDIQIDKSFQAPQATGSSSLNPGVQAGLNLDSRHKAIDQTVYPFDPSNPSSFNYSTAVSIYDSRGNAHTLTTFYVKTTTAASNGGIGTQWNVYATVDGKNGLTTSTATNSAGTGLAGSISLGGQDNAVIEFDAAGKMVYPNSTTTMPTVSIDWATLDPELGVTTPQTFQINFTKTTSYGSADATNSLLQDGYATGQLTGVSITDDGMVQGKYSNGQSKNMGRIVLYDFANPNGLQPIGNNQWQETFVSGQPVPGAPRTGYFGSLKSASVEESNVDLTTQLVAMIVQQRNYQANAQTIKTQDQVLQTLVNMR